MPKTRWQAFLIHLGLCAVIYLALLYLIVFVWYPQPYFAADGGWQGIRIVTGVDLVLGPVLTLVVYKLGKPGLKRDLAVIAALQTVALAWGTWVVYEQRTAMVVFAEGTFFSLNNEEVQNAGGKAPGVAAQALTRPPYAFVRLPADKKARLQIMMRMLASGRPLHQLGDHYEPLGPANLPEVLARGLDIDHIMKISESNRSRVERFVAEHGGGVADYSFLPLNCRYHDLVLVLHRSDGRVAGALDIRRSAPVTGPSRAAEPGRPS